MNNHDNHYLTLGLQRGATQEEIHAAFQRMSVKYHPDNDSSLDAEMKFHEARQAYAALTKPAEPSFTPPEPPNATRSQTSEPPPNSRTREQASGFSGSTGGARQQTTDNHGTAGFTLNPSGAKNNSNNRKNFHEAVKDNHDRKATFKNYYAEEEPDESAQFLDFPIHDYFFRLKLVLTVIASIAITFVALKNLSYLPTINESVTERLLKHTIVFISASWLIFWYIRFTNPSRSLSGFVIFFLGIAYACWICFYALGSEFHQFSRTLRIGTPTAPASELFVYCIIFAGVFFSATHYLEKDGLRVAYSRFFAGLVRASRSK